MISAGVSFHLLAFHAFPHPLCRVGSASAGVGTPECLPFPPAPPLTSALVEAAAFVSRGAGSSTGPSLAPFVLQMGKPDAAGRGRGIGFLRVPPAEDLRTPPSGPVPQSGASPGGGLPPRALAPGRRGAVGGSPGSPALRPLRVPGAGARCSAGVRGRPQRKPGDPSPDPLGNSLPSSEPTRRLPPGTIGCNSMRPFLGPPSGLAIS